MPRLLKTVHKFGLESDEPLLDLLWQQNKDRYVTANITYVMRFWPEKWKKNIKSSVHRPGIEPGSREWESRMITITPTVPLVYNRKNGCIWKFVFALLNSGDYVFVSKLLSSCWNQSMLDEFYVKLKSRLRFRPVSIERVSEVSKIRSLRILRTCK